MATRRGWCGVGTALGAALLAALPLGAQSQPRVATTVDLLLKFPSFFHRRTVAVLASPVQRDGAWHIAIPEPRTFLLVPRSGGPSGQVTEARGTFVDVARLTDESGLPAYSTLQSLVRSLYPDQVLSRGRVLALADSTFAEPADLTTPSLRSLVLNPSAFDGKTVTVRGRFRGQNLFADLPYWPRDGQWDFVLQSADASLWITRLRPRGRGFDLDPTTRRSATTWLEVTGTVHIEGGFPRLVGTRIEQSQPEPLPPMEPVAARPPDPPPAMIFTAPANNEADISSTAVVRIQFSRPMAPDSFERRVRVTYGDGASDAVPSFTATYQPDSRGLDIKFAAPLARSALVTVELLTGITAADGTPLAPASIKFTVER